MVDLLIWDEGEYSCTAVRDPYGSTPQNFDATLWAGLDLGHTRLAKTAWSRWQLAALTGFRL